jgi:hypothetical protein
MYKDCIMNEMEGKSIPYTKQQLQLQLQHQQQQQPYHQTSSMNEDKSKALDSLV